MRLALGAPLSRACAATPTVSAIASSAATLPVIVGNSSAAPSLKALSLASVMRLSLLARVL